MKLKAKVLPKKKVLPKAGNGALIVNKPALIVNKPRAECHPDKEEISHGLCISCFTAQSAKLDPATFPNRAESPSAFALAQLDRKRELSKIFAQAKRKQALVEDAKNILTYNLIEYADLHMHAARSAAADGDAKPAQWALERVKVPEVGTVVEPPAEAAANQGIRVFIGVKVGGIEANVTSDGEVIVDGSAQSNVQKQIV